MFLLIHDTLSVVVDDRLPAVDFVMGTFPTADILRLDQNLTFGSFTFGASSLAAGTYTAGQLNTLFGNGSQFVNAGGSLTVVPEPGTTALVALSLGAFVMTMRRRRSSL